jgi:hypothetical protein
MLIAPPEFLVNLCQPWNKFYSDSKLAETLVQFAHTAALVVAGGIAIATDRNTLRAYAWSDDVRNHHLTELNFLHRTVVTGLTLSVISGLAMFAADVETFWGSWIFWVKMILVAILLANGARMLGVENKLRADPAATSPQWAKLRFNAITSIGLWLTTTLAGLALLNYA